MQRALLQMLTDHATLTFEQTLTQVFAFVRELIVMVLQALGREVSLSKDTL